MTRRPATTATAPERLPRLAGLPAPGLLRAMATETRVRVLETRLRGELGRRLDVRPAHRVRGVAAVPAAEPGGGPAPRGGGDP